ncbi:MAG: gliding motility-associated C-terminal domain-containing protein [Saprospiraceae bacterium]|nr:gliding motility-associated C-terminal domain-containing protein [Saprospiraceae bacterium]
MKRIVTFLCFSLLMCNLYAQEHTFDCNGDLIITLYGNNFGNTNAHNISVTDDQATFNDLTTFFGLQVNSTAFNSVDRYIYGIAGNNIMRLKSNGSFENLGQPSYFPNTVRSFAGDFDSEGIFWIHERLTSTFIGIDINNGLQEKATLQLQWHPSTGNSGPFTNDIDDLAFDPLEPTVMYTYQRYGDAFPAATRGHLLRVDMDPASTTYGYIFSEGALSSSVIIHLGALFFDSKGVLFGYGGVVSPSIQNQLIKIDRDPAVAVTIAQGPAASANDGCSCPFSMYLTKATEDSYNVCLSELMKFDYVIGNSSNIVPSGVIFNDSFPIGFEIVNIEFSEEFGVISNGTGIGTNKIEITDISFSNKQVTFSIFVRPNGVSGFYNIQADLTNLPERFGERLVSDDPETFFNDDPTKFIVDYDFFPENFSIGADVIMCEGETANFLANLPLPGTEIVWNGSGVGTSFSTDQSGMIVAEAVLGVCSAYDTAMVETVPYPEPIIGDDQFLCLGETTQLSVPFEPNILYTWNTGVFSNTLDVNESGTYILEVNDRGCKSQDTAEVVYVFEDFEFGFDDVAVCEGTPIRLSANSEFPVGYNWIYPDGSTGKDSLLRIGNSTPQNSGTYTLEMEYLECKYSSDFDILVNPIPSIELESEITYDICDSINLSVISDPDVNISWSPSSMVDCPDCESITAKIIKDTYFEVTATDEIGCAATDTIHVLIEDTGLGTPVHIPNVFTPNGDRQNDEFIIRPLCYTILEFKIYDRWGNMVYTKDMQPNSDSVQWDGYNQIGLCKNGVYVWYGLFKFINSDEEVILSGDVTLLR